MLQGDIAQLICLSTHHVSHKQDSPEVSSRAISNLVSFLLRIQSTAEMVQKKNLVVAHGPAMPSGIESPGRSRQNHLGKIIEPWHMLIAKSLPLSKGSWHKSPQGFMIPPNHVIPRNTLPQKMGIFKCLMSMVEECMTTKRHQNSSSQWWIWTAIDSTKLSVCVCI